MKAPLPLLLLPCLLAASAAVPAPCRPGQLLPHPGDCAAFLRCTAAGRPQPVASSCPRGLHFSPRLQRCTLPVFARCAPVHDVAVDKAAVKSSFLDIIQTLFKENGAKQLPEAEPEELNNERFQREEPKGILKLPKDSIVLPKLPASDKANYRHTFEVKELSHISEDSSKKFAERDSEENIKADTASEVKEIVPEEMEEEASNKHESNAKETEVKEHEADKLLSEDIDEEEEKANPNEAEDENENTQIKEQHKFEEQEDNDHEVVERKVSPEEDSESERNEEKGSDEKETNAENQQEEDDEGAEKKKDGMVIKKDDEEDEDKIKKKSQVAKKSEKEDIEEKEHEKDDDSESEAESEEEE